MSVRGPSSSRLALREREPINKRCDSFFSHPVLVSDRLRVGSGAGPLVLSTGMLCVLPLGAGHTWSAWQTQGLPTGSPTTWRSRKFCDSWPHTLGMTLFVRLQYRRLFELSLSTAPAALDALWDCAATNAAAVLALSFFAGLFEVCGCSGICIPRPSHLKQNSGCLYIIESAKRWNPDFFTEHRYFAPLFCTGPRESSDAAVGTPDCSQRVDAIHIHPHTIADALWVLQGRLPATSAWSGASEYLTTCGSSSSPSTTMKSEQQKSYLDWQRTWRAAQSMRS